MRRKADYEKAYGRYESAPAPSYDSIDMAVDIFPEERRLESRGGAILGNHKQAPISEFVVSVKPILRVNQIAVENATLAQSDKAQGFYLFRLDQALGLPAGDLRKPLSGLDGAALAAGLRIVQELGLDRRYNYQVKPAAVAA